MSRGRAPDGWWLAGLAGLALLVAVALSRWTFDMWTWQPDELLFRSTATWVGDHLPQSLWATDEFRRGTQRLNVLLLAAALDVFGSPDGFRVARWVVMLAFVSTCIPVFLLARRAGAAAPWAAVAGVLCLVIPWAGLTGTFLTEGLAYPLYAWACLAIWAAAARPSGGRDVLALVAIAAAMLARTGLVVLLAALVIAVAGAELRRPALDPGARVRLGAALRRHRVLAVVLALGALAALAGGSSTLTGSWYEGAGVRWSALPDAASYTVGVVGAGLLFVPLIAALTLAYGEVVRPETAERLALGLVVLGTLVATVLTMSVVVFEERYVFLVAAPVCAAFAVLAGSGRARPWAVALAGLTVGVAVLSRTWAAGTEFWTYLTYPGPAQSFQAQVVRSGINARLPDALRMDGDVLVALLVAAATVLVLLVTMRGRDGRRAGYAPALAGVTAVLLVAGGAAQAHWALRKFAEAGGGGRSLTSRTALDRALGDRTAGLWLPPATVGDTLAFWQEARYYSLRLQDRYRSGGSQDAQAFRGERTARVLIDPASGAARARDGRPLPELMATIARQVSAPLAGPIVAADPALGIVVIDSGLRPRVRWLLDGAWADGWLRLGAPATLRVPGAGSGRCMRLFVVAGGAGPVRVRVRSGAVTRVLALAPGATAAPLVRVRGPGAPARVVLSATGAPARLADGRLGAAQVVPRGVVRCPAPEVRQ